MHKKYRQWRVWFLWFYYYRSLSYPITFSSIYNIQFLNSALAVRYLSAMTRQQTCWRTRVTNHVSFDSISIEMFLDLCNIGGNVLKILVSVLTIYLGEEEMLQRKWGSGGRAIGTRETETVWPLKFSCRSECLKNLILVKSKMKLAWSRSTGEMCRSQCSHLPFPQNSLWLNECIELHVRTHVLGENECRNTYIL